MSTTTSYMGLTLKNPIIVGASTYTNSAAKIKKLEQHGAAAVVLKSLYEEQILADSGKLVEQDEMYFWYPEAIEVVNGFSKEDGVEEYLNLIKDAKSAVDIPVIASINCRTPKEWPAFAQKIESAGADGLELNIYISPADIDAGRSVEDTYLAIVKEVRANTKLPIAVKIGYYFSDVARFVTQLSSTGIEGLVLFNRYFRPDIDIEALRLANDNIFSAPQEITLSLRWVALLADKVECDLAGATGVHDYTGVVKELLAGAKAVQVVSALYKSGPQAIEKMVSGLETWMQKHNYDSVDAFRGMVAKGSENTAAFERVQFMRRTTGQYQEAPR